MEKYQFTLLTWLHFSDSEAKTASRWYQGPGWYWNPCDTSGNRLDARCAAKSEPANHHAGQLEALNHCGADGWSVATFVPVAQEVATFVPAALEGELTQLMQGIVELSANGPYFILQRRASA